jgi:hypothetical protein
VLKNEGKLRWRQHLLTLITYYLMHRVVGIVQSTAVHSFLHVDHNRGMPAYGRSLKETPSYAIFVPAVNASYLLPLLDLFTQGSARSDHLLPVRRHNEFSHDLAHAQSFPLWRSTARRSLLDHIDHYASRQEARIYPTSDN